MANSSDLTKQPPKIRVYIHEHSRLARISAWKLKEDSIALTLGNHIFLHHVTRKDFLNNTPWVAHELAHVCQFKKYGLVRFIFLYIWESSRKGYYLNRWEVEARLQSIDHTILDRFYFV